MIFKEQKIKPYIDVIIEKSLSYEEIDNDRSIRESHLNLQLLYIEKNWNVRMFIFL